MSFGGDRDQLTVCAVATPPGYGGISVIRVSGSQALSVVRKCFPKLPVEAVSHKAYFGTVYDPSTMVGIDQVLVLYLAEGKSFTGEHTLEISCHGSPIICDQILKALINSGASAALPGEFTYRAFMNNRLDLVQAESVLSLIESRSQKAAQLSFRQLEGDLSEKIEAIEKELTWCLAHIEANIDFATEGLEVSSMNELISKVESCSVEVNKLLKTYQQGKIIKDGLKVALVGQPNAGKSSLLNLLLGFDRAIVDATPGTTRDVVDADTVFKGIRIVFQDTAGLREGTRDHIEAIGIQRSQNAAESADLIVFVFDAEKGWSSEDEKWLKRVAGKPVLFLTNKMDRVSTDFDREKLVKNLQLSVAGGHSPVLFVSALDKMCRELILDEIYKSVIKSEKSDDEVALSQARHYENLLKARKFMDQSILSMKEGVGAEFVSLELKEALIALQETLGKYFDDQIMDRVFKEFCIGK